MLALKRYKKRYLNLIYWQLGVLMKKTFENSTVPKKLNRSHIQNDRTIQANIPSENHVGKLYFMNMKTP